MEETKISGSLPNLDVEIVRKEDPAGGAEMVSIHMRATPGFQQAAAMLAPALAPALAGVSPLGMWMQAAQAVQKATQDAMQPMMAALGSSMLPGAMPNLADMTKGMPAAKPFEPSNLMAMACAANPFLAALTKGGKQD